MEADDDEPNVTLDLSRAITKMAELFMQYSRNTRLWVGYEPFCKFVKDILPRVDANVELRDMIWKQMKHPLIISPMDHFITAEDKGLVLLRSPQLRDQEANLVYLWGTMPLHYTLMGGLEAFPCDEKRGDPLLDALIIRIMERGIAAVTVIVPHPVPDRAIQIRIALRAVLIKEKIDEGTCREFVNNLPIIAPSRLYTMSPQDERRWHIIVDQAHVFGTADNFLWIQWAATGIAAKQTMGVDIVSCSTVPSPMIGMCLNYHLPSMGYLTMDMGLTQLMLMIDDIWYNRMYFTKKKDVCNMGKFLSTSEPLYWLVRATPSGEARDIQKNHVAPLLMSHISTLVSLETLVTICRTKRASGNFKVRIALHQLVAEKFSLDDWLILLSYAAGARLMIVHDKVSMVITVREYVENLIRNAHEKVPTWLKTHGPDVTCL